jgi:hypothetical protein
MFLVVGVISTFLVVFLGLTLWASGGALKTHNPTEDDQVSPH